jgi:hypothetical protein
MAPILAALASKGLNLLYDAVSKKGQAFVEEKLGVKLKPDMTDEEALKYKQLEFDNEESLRKWALEELKVTNEAITARWQADMLSDSWLSKNIRPMVLLILLSVYFMFAFLSGFDFYVNTAYVELLAQMLMLVMGAYFAGRTVEKVVDMRERGK